MLWELYPRAAKTAYLGVALIILSACGPSGPSRIDRDDARQQILRELPRHEVHFGGYGGTFSKYYDLREVLITDRSCEGNRCTVVATIEATAKEDYAAETVSEVMVGPFVGRGGARIGDKRKAEGVKFVFVKYDRGWRIDSFPHDRRDSESPF